ncbi:MAG: excisionase family DNA binding protein [Lysobacterales bacterium]
MFFGFSDMIWIMRTSTYDRLTAAPADELLTSGEAAKFLNSSRQHVVNLCERGELPFTTIGTHRRILRSDLELIRTRTNRSTRDQRRSLWLAYATAGKIVSDPEAAKHLALANIKNMRRSVRGQANRWLEEWEALLNGPTDRLLQSLISPSPKSRELRQNNPLAGLLSEEERACVLEAWREEMKQP